MPTWTLNQQTGRIEYLDEFGEPVIPEANSRIDQASGLAQRNLGALQGRMPVGSRLTRGMSGNELADRMIAYMRQFRGTHGVADQLSPLRHYPTELPAAGPEPDLAESLGLQPQETIEERRKRLAGLGYKPGTRLPSGTEIHESKINPGELRFVGRPRAEIEDLYRRGMVEEAQAAEEALGRQKQQQILRELNRRNRERAIKAGLPAPAAVDNFADARAMRDTLRSHRSQQARERRGLGGSVGMTGALVDARGNVNYEQAAEVARVTALRMAGGNPVAARQLLPLVATAITRSAESIAQTRAEKFQDPEQRMEEMVAALFGQFASPDSGIPADEITRRLDEFRQYMGGMRGGNVPGGVPVGPVPSGSGTVGGGLASPSAPGRLTTSDEAILQSILSGQDPANIVPGWPDAWSSDRKYLPGFIARAKQRLPHLTEQQIEEWYNAMTGRVPDERKTWVHNTPYP